MKLLKAWKERGKILEGIKNSVFTSKEVEGIAEERENICKKCPYYDTKGTKCLMPGTQPCCGHCGCSLKFKTRSLSSECPIGKWKALVTEEEEENIDYDKI